MKYAGIDGCRAGWVVAVVEEKQLSIRLVDKLQIFDFTGISKIYIDIPLHFAQQQYLACELEVRHLLGRQKQASVFLTPHREAVYAETFAEANAINKARMGKGVSIQTWNILGKIKEAVAFATSQKELLLQEAHPELCFWFVNNRQPLLSGKATAAGIAERMRLIESELPACLPVIEQTLAETKRKDVKPDDILDAAALAIRAASPYPQAVLPICEEHSAGNIFF